MSSAQPSDPTELALIVADHMLPVILSKITEITKGGEVREPNPHSSNCWQLTLAPLSQWMVLVVDDASKKILDNAVKEDDILERNIASTCRHPVQFAMPMSQTPYS